MAKTRGLPLLWSMELSEFYKICRIQDLEKWTKLECFVNLKSRNFILSSRSKAWSHHERKGALCNSHLDSDTRNFLEKGFKCQGSHQAILYNSAHHLILYKRWKLEYEYHLWLSGHYKRLIIAHYYMPKVHGSNNQSCKL